MTHVITRFAPSPTGFLHIGGARTALFNYIFAKRHGGQFVLRIEDTDRERSTDEATQAILDGLSWLGLDWDGEAVSQFARRERHKEVAEELLKQGKAYYCYASPEELEEMRETARKEGRQPKYDGRWRDRDASEAPEGVKPVIRIKAEQTGSTTILDMVQGEVTVDHEQLDDMVLLRADGTPTYMLAVVVDDYDMNITHVIRGDDHLNNTFRQIQIYKAMDWPMPHFAHIPLIHGNDGAKLSKRHGALGVEAYRDMGYLPEALNNYLMRLGWSHGDQEIISMAEAKEVFALDKVGKAPSRFDFDKLKHVNHHYMKEATPEDLLKLLPDFLLPKITDKAAAWLLRGIPSLVERSETLLDLAANAQTYLYDGEALLDEEASMKFADGGAERMTSLLPSLEAVTDWAEANIKDAVKAYCKEHDLKLGKVGPFIRICLTGKTQSPSIFEMMDILGKDETISRIKAQV